MFVVNREVVTPSLVVNEIERFAMIRLFVGVTPRVSMSLSWSIIINFNWPCQNFCSISSWLFIRVIYSDRGRVDDLSFFDYLSLFCFFVNRISLYFFHIL